MNDRHRILRHNQAIREGRAARPRRLDDGEVVFKIPVEDMKVLTKLYPELNSTDHKTRLAAWQKLRRSPVGERYLVAKPATAADKASRIIVR